MNHPLMAMLEQAMTDNEDEGPGLTDEQVVTRLREVLAKRQKFHDFTEGQVLRHKYPSLACTRDAAVPHIFVEWIEPIHGTDLMREPSDIGGMASALVADCRVLTISHGTAHYWLTDSADWEPHPDFAEPVN